MIRDCSSGELAFRGKIPLLKKEVNQNLVQVDAGTIESEVEKKKRRIRQDLKFSTPSKAQGGEYWRLIETDGPCLIRLCFWLFP
jgi:hypothetical protein